MGLAWLSIRRLGACTHLLSLRIVPQYHEQPSPRQSVSGSAKYATPGQTPSLDTILNREWTPMDANKTEWIATLVPTIPLSFIIYSRILASIRGSFLFIRSTFGRRLRSR